MGAAIWSTSQNDIRKFPAKLFISFWENHRLLQVLNRPKWRTLKNGSISYINAVIDQSNMTIKLNHPVDKIERSMDGVRIYSNGEPFEFDQVIIGAHADQALKCWRLHRTKKKHFWDNGSTPKTLRYYTLTLRLRPQNDQPGHLGYTHDQMMIR